MSEHIKNWTLEFFVLLTDLNVIRDIGMNCYKGRMNTATLLADPATIRLTYIRPAADSITIVVKAIYFRKIINRCRKTFAPGMS